MAGYVYTLDANGNRSKAVVSEPQLPEQLINTNQNYSYNASKNRLTSINTNNTPLTYDDEGQTKTQGSTSYSNISTMPPATSWSKPMPATPSANTISTAKA